MKNSVVVKPLCGVLASAVFWLLAAPALAATPVVDEHAGHHVEAVESHKSAQPDATASLSAHLEVQSAWARATSPVATMGAVYGTWRNASDETLTITGITTSAAAMAQIHETREVDGMMRMRHIDPVSIAPGEQLELVPGGMHLMLMNLAAPLVEGERFEVSLLLANGEAVTVPVTTGAIDQFAAP